MIDVEHAVIRKRLKLADVLVEFRLIGARFHLHESSFIRCWQRHFYVDRLLRASDIALTTPAANGENEAHKRFKVMPR